MLLFQKKKKSNLIFSESSRDGRKGKGGTFPSVNSTL